MLNGFCFLDLNRVLHLVLYTAERAWSHAMEKRQLSDGPNARQRIYLIGRLRKAVKWATLFSQLCVTKGDSRTSLEAEVCSYLFMSSYSLIVVVDIDMHPWLRQLLSHLRSSFTFSASQG